MTQPIQAPFPYFGGKSKIADLVWSRFGDPQNYVEPFFGSGAVMLMRPTAPQVETVNDADAFLCNFWRAIKSDPEAVAEYAAWPVNECDIEARHKWLVQTARKRELASATKNDPDYYDAKIAGWWVWGLCSWIGRGWCCGEWFGAGDERNAGTGINVRDEEHGGKRPSLGNAGRGVHRGDVAKQIPQLGGSGCGVHRLTKRGRLVEWFGQLADRLRNVRVCCGDWTRVMGPSVTFRNGLTGVFLDPPYSAEANRDNDIYKEESASVAHDVRRWCVENGDNPLLRIALCGYEGEHDELESMGWSVVAWKAGGGYANQGEGRGKNNRLRERVWFSPACIGEPSLF